MKKQNMKLSPKKILSIIGSVVGCALLIAVGILTYINMTGKVAFVGKYAVVRIVSGSMEPTIPTGEYILIEKVTEKNVGSLAEKDVIMFYCRNNNSEIYNRLNTHRIVSVITGDYGVEYITKGDNNNVRDEGTVKQKDVVGKFIKNVDWLTKTASFFQKRWAFFFLIVIPAGVLLMISIREVIKKSHEVKVDLLVAEKVKELKQASEKTDSDKPDSDNNSEDDTDVS